MNYYYNLINAMFLVKIKSNYRHRANSKVNHFNRNIMKYT